MQTTSLPNCSRPMLRVSRAARSAIYVVPLLTASLLASGPALAASDVAACVGSHASGQRERRAGHMRLAEQLFQACAADVCPREIRRECLTFLDGLRDIIPTLVFVATDADGHDITDAQVYTGEERLAERLDGRAVAVDPGKHTFRFVLPTGEVLTSEVLVREGDKSRQVRVSMAPKDGPKAVVDSPKPVVQEIAPPPPPPPPRKNYTPAWIATGLAVVGAAGFGTFALLGKSEQSDLDKCAPNCAAGSDNTMRSFYAVADVSLLVGVLSAGFATYFFLKPPTVAGVRTQVGVQAQGNNLGFIVGGQF